ncbi:hypothetical protein AMATHDRAFT_7783 [Amanita thiersii Skay4041]|uniref:Uncharacterized protein n=1 Tax=Amanita thiersii Skay4041 TaxID=703135 RepID=A0A2A9N855_9AGAR|nr:hypothetical protein AMATHDRAFT_7783 [Amanita thiersii Skay4041]
MSNPCSTAFVTSQFHTFSEPPFINAVHSLHVDTTILSSGLGTILDDLPMEVDDVFLEKKPTTASNIHTGTSPFHSLVLTTAPKSPFVDGDNSSRADPTVVLSGLGTIRDDLPMEVDDIFMLEKPTTALNDAATVHHWMFDNTRSFSEEDHGIPRAIFDDGVDDAMEIDDAYVAEKDVDGRILT